MVLNCIENTLLLNDNVHVTNQMALCPKALT